MSVAGQSETLFDQVDDLGAGIAAIGDLLQFGKDEAYPDTLNGVGIVLRRLGASMRDLHEQFLGKTYQDIRALEIKVAEATAARQVAEKMFRENAEISTGEPLNRSEVVAELAQILDEAVAENHAKNVKASRDSIRIVPT